MLFLCFFAMIVALVTNSGQPDAFYAPETQSRSVLHSLALFDFRRRYEDFRGVPKFVTASDQSSSHAVNSPPELVSSGKAIDHLFARVDSPNFLGENDIQQQLHLPRLSSQTLSRNTRTNRISRRRSRKLYSSISEEISINTTTEGDQTSPYALSLKDKAVIVWADDNNANKLIGQLVDLDLNKIGGEFTINLNSNLRSQAIFSAALLNDGYYVVGWEATDENIYAKIFNGDTAQGEEFQINLSSSKKSVNLSIAGLNNGNFVVTWKETDSSEVDDEIYFQIFKLDGEKSGLQTTVYSDDGTLFMPRIASLDNGNFVITWFIGTDEDGYEISYKLFDSSGNVIEINDDDEIVLVGDNQEDLGIASSNDGRFMIVWSGQEPDGKKEEVFAQLFENSGERVESPFQLNTHTEDTQRPEDISGLYDGGFLVTWNSKNQDTNGMGIFGRRYDSDGNPVDDEFPINETTDNDQRSSNIAATSDGFIVAWNSMSQDGDGNGIFAKIYHDDIENITANYPLEDVSIYLSQYFSYVISANTFSSTDSSSELTYSVRIKIGEEYHDINSTWLSFDSSSRTLSGTPNEEGTYVIEVTATQGNASGIEDFQITVLPNTKPIVYSRLPIQLIPFNSQNIWEYYIPTNTFKDLEGDTIYYTGAYSIVDGVERDLNVLWTSLAFNNEKLYGIPNLSGNFTIRIYADDGMGELNPNSVEMHVEVFSQGTEILELYEIAQAGLKGLITENLDHVWIAKENSLKRFDLTSKNPLFITDSNLEYFLPSRISDVEELSKNEILVGESSGSVTLFSSSDTQEYSALSVKEPISDILVEDQNNVYVSHQSSISQIQVIDNLLQLVSTAHTDRLINKIVKIGDIIYSATDRGIYEMNLSLDAFQEITISDLGYIYDIAAYNSYLYALDGTNLIIIDASNPNNLKLMSKKQLLGSANQLSVFSKDEDTLCMTIEGEESVNIINVSNPKMVTYEGYYQSADPINGIFTEKNGRWALILKENHVYSVEIFRRELFLTTCDATPDSDTCVNTLSIQAGTEFSKEFTINELLPVFKPGYFYGFFYIFNAFWVSDDKYASLPSWMDSNKEDFEIFKLFGTIPDSQIGSGIHFEVTAYAYSTDSEIELTLTTLISLSVVARDASLAFPISDQSLQLGDEWLFSFSSSTFTDADEFECEYKIDSEWIKSYDLPYIRFIPESRQWYISSSDSNKQTLFQCDPCDNSEHSKTYTIKVTARNSESSTDLGTWTTFSLFLYSERIPDQEIHPGISQTVILDEDIFPIGVTYIVSLLGKDGEAELLPWWMSYISNERKILMFPSASEVGENFDIQITGNNDGVELVSEFQIKVRNEDPIILNTLGTQRIKLGDLLDYSIPQDTFSDPDEDSLTYSARWINKDGKETSALPSWLNFDSNTRTFYGVPTTEATLSLKVYVDDGLGGEVSQELFLDCYNTKPERNFAVSLENQSVHIGNFFSFTISSILFLDADGDSLSYSATQSDGSALPSWLTFNTVSLLFSGTPTDIELLDNPLSIQVSANDGYSSESASFSLDITNTAPVVSYSISDQLTNQVNQGTLLLKPGERLNFQLSSTTFTDQDNDSLSYTARLLGGDPLPEWLVFDSNTILFYGTPTETQELSISVAAFDGYTTTTDTFQLAIQNEVPSVSISLQSQFDNIYPYNLTDGSSFYFQFSSSTFQDNDDESLAYSAQYMGEDDEEWRSLELSWLNFESKTFSGTVYSSSMSDYTLTIQVTASDGFESITDQFTFTIVSLFPDPSDNLIHIESQRDTVEIEIYTNGAKLSVFSYGSVSAFDLSNDLKTDWKLEGAPSDINYILERVKYRESSGRLLIESKVYLKIEGIEQEYPISIFPSQDSIISYSISDKSTYFENIFSLNVKKYFYYSDQDSLTYSFLLIDKPGGSKDWLSFDSRTISGIPTDSTDVGEYKIAIIVVDEFGDSESESFTLEVEYTILQLLVSFLFLVLEFGGPVLTILGLFAIRKYLINRFFKSSKIFAPLEMDKDEISARKFLILRTDEEKAAKKLYRKLPKNYQLDDENLIYDLDRIIFEKNSTQKDYNSVVYPEIYDLSKSTAEYSSFKHCLENDECLLIEIDKENYCARYLYLCVKDRIHRNNLNKNQKKELKILINNFKDKMLNSYYQKLLRTHNYNSVGSWTKSKDAWTMEMPNLCNLSTTEYYDISHFLRSQKSNINYDIILNSLRIEYWKDRAIRLDDISELEEVKIFSESDLCCKMKSKKIIEEWVYRKCLKVNLTDEELKIEFNPSEKTFKEIVFVQLFNRDGYLLFELTLVPSSKPRNQISSKMDLKRSNIESSDK